MTDNNMEAWVAWGDANLPARPPDMPGPNETRLNLIDGVEYITVRANDFRDAMRIRDDLQVEVGRLTRADKQWADHVKRLADEVARLRAELRTCQETLTACLEST